MSIHSDPVEFALPSRWLFGRGTLINDQGDEGEDHLFMFFKKWNIYHFSYEWIYPDIKKMNLDK